MNVTRASRTGVPMGPKSMLMPFVIAIWLIPGIATVVVIGVSAWLLILAGLIVYTFHVSIRNE